MSIMNNLNLKPLNQLNFSLGFSLVEMLVVLGVMAIAAIILIPEIGKYNDQKALENTVNELISTIKTVQNNAAGGVVCQLTPINYRATSWNINFDKRVVSPTPLPPINSYCFNTTNFKNNNIFLPPGIVITSITLDGTPVNTANISFDNLNSNAVIKETSAGTTIYGQAKISLYSAYSGGHTVDLYVEKSGAVYVSIPTLIPDLTPVPTVPFPTPTCWSC